MLEEIQTATENTLTNIFEEKEKFRSLLNILFDGYKIEEIEFSKEFNK